MRHFLFDSIFTIVCLVVAAWWGFSHGGILGLGKALAITGILAIMEISLSFDNAVVNASILKGWNDFWKKIFLTVGILIAVFGMRLVFPIVIVAITANLGFMEVVNLALNNPEQYAAHLNEHHAEISAFGGMFLLLVFLTFLFGEKEILWFKWLESKLTRFSKLDTMSTFVAIIVLLISLNLIDDARKSVILMAGIWGILVYLGVNVLSTLLEGTNDSSSNKNSNSSLVNSLDNNLDSDLNSSLNSNLNNQFKNNADDILTDSHGNIIKNTAGVSPTILKGGLAGFIYLEVLDASFSFDGVIGAFAITNDVIIIMLGLAIGAMFVRSMTLYLVDKGTLNEFVYLEHGAHYAIGALSIIMLLSMKFHIPELVTGLIGIAFIGLSLFNSIQYRNRNET